jgi:hypothetical protein
MNSQNSENGIDGCTHHVEVGISSKLASCEALSGLFHGSQGAIDFRVLILLMMHTRKLEGDDFETLHQKGLVNQKHEKMLYTRITDLGLSKISGIHRESIAKSLLRLEENGLIITIKIGTKTIRDTTGQFNGTKFHLITNESTRFISKIFFNRVDQTSTVPHRVGETDTVQPNSDTDRVDETGTADAEHPSHRVDQTSTVPHRVGETGTADAEHPSHRVDQISTVPHRVDETDTVQPNSDTDRVDETGTADAEHPSHRVDETSTVPHRVDETDTKEEVVVKEVVNKLINNNYNNLNQKEFDKNFEEKLIEFFATKVGKEIKKDELHGFLNLAKQYNPEAQKDGSTGEKWVLKALDNGLGTAKNYLAYTRGILRNWSTEARKSLPKMTQTSAHYEYAGREIYWPKLLKRLEVKIGKRDFISYLQGSHEIELNENNLTVGVGNRYTKEYIESNLATIVNRELSAMLDMEAKVNFVVTDDYVTHD